MFKWGGFCYRWVVDEDCQIDYVLDDIIYVVDDEYAKDASDWEWGWRWWLWVYGGQLQETKHQKYLGRGGWMLLILLISCIHTFMI